MITLSGALIVKNEEKVLRRCLDSFKPLLDELIIVDTGSTDNTKSIAREYTDKVYDYEWNNDFSKARNYAFSKCTKDCIFTIDADEYIEEVSRSKINWIKQILPDDIDIVIMNYVTDMNYNTIYNFKDEKREKIFRRLRQFHWQYPLHESVITVPVVYTSDIDIIHSPVSLHSTRDFSIYIDTLNSQETLPEKLWIMYSHELFISGEDKDFINAKPYFAKHLNDNIITEEEVRASLCVLVKAARLTNDYDMLLSCTAKNMSMDEASSEVCYELGQYYEDKKNYDEAFLWYYNAAFETGSACNIHYCNDLPLNSLARIEHFRGNKEESEKYKSLALEKSADIV